MNTKYDGGAAFPVIGAHGAAADYGGMSLRDYFATKASEEDIRSVMTMGESWQDPDDRCNARYRYADAMLKARAR